MSNPVCSVATLITNTPCFKQQVLDPKHQLALKIYFAVLELAAMGGTDYSATLATTLHTDANTLAQNMTIPEVETSHLALGYNRAIAAGASPSSNINTLMGNIKCLINTRMPDLEKEWLLLQCKLGVHKAYPQ